MRVWAFLDRIGQTLAALPRWSRLLTALLTTALGAVILTRPTTSLEVLALLIGIGLIVHGLVELLTGSDQNHTGGRGWVAARLLTAAAGVLAGIFVLTHGGLTVRLLALIAALALIVNGGLTTAAGLRRNLGPDRRIASLAFGLAGIVLGVVALSWPDITLLVVSVVFGARLIMLGLSTAWTALVPAPKAASGPTPEPAPDRARPRRPSLPTPRNWRRTFVAVVCLLLACGAAVLSAAIQEGSPVVDAFYAPPRDVPNRPGELIRSEPFTTGVPDDARAWRILYTTTRGDGSAAVASGLVVVPAHGGGDWPVIDWAHGTTGYAQDCAPSLAREPFESGALMLLPEILAQGWAVVATDYIGLGTSGPHPYLIGSDSAHAVLDAARAARQLPDADLGDLNIVWGHSQGGGAALWTGALAAQYAPDLTISGVAALAPASNLAGLVESLGDVTGGSVFASFVIAAYSAVYGDVSFGDYIRPGARVTVRQMAERCLAPPGVFASVLTLLALARDPQILSTDPSNGSLGARLRENTPPATITAPLLIGQGVDDSIVLAQMQDEYVASLCAAGQPVDYRRFAGLDHLPLVDAESALVPELLAWTRDRLAGEPALEQCHTVLR